MSPPCPIMTPLAYVDLIDRRFSNPQIFDTTRRVAFDGASRHTGFVIPTLREALAAGAPFNGLALVEALWARMCEGTREDGTVIAANDPVWDELQTAAKAARTHPRAWLDQPRIYGDLAEVPAFAEAFESWLAMIWDEGAESALRAYLAEGPIPN